MDVLCGTMAPTQRARPVGSSAAELPHGPLALPQAPSSRAIKEAAQSGPRCVRYSHSPLYHNQFHYDIVDEGEMNSQ